MSVYDVTKGKHIQKIRAILKLNPGALHMSSALKRRDCHKNIQSDKYVENAARLYTIYQPTAEVCLSRRYYPLCQKLHLSQVKFPRTRGGIQMEKQRALVVTEIEVK